MSFAAAKSAINKSLGSITSISVVYDGTMRGEPPQSSISQGIYIARNGALVVGDVSGSSLQFTMQGGNGNWIGALEQTEQAAPGFSRAQLVLVHDLIRHAQSYGANGLEVSWP